MTASTMRNHLYHRTPLSRVRRANCTRRTRPKNHPAPPCTTTPQYPCTARNLLPSIHHQCQIQANTVFHPGSILSSSPPLRQQPIRPTLLDAKSFASALLGTKPAPHRRQSLTRISSFVSRVDACAPSRGLIVNNATLHMSRVHMVHMHLPVL